MDSFGKVGDTSTKNQPRKFIKTPVYKDPEDLSHELNHAKIQINEMTKERKILNAKIVMLQRGNAKLEKRNDEALITQSLGGGRGVDTNVGLKNANKLQETRIKVLEGEVKTLHTNLRFTKVVENEVELKAYYQEVCDKFD
jgi:hypothetical protein